MVSRQIEVVGIVVHVSGAGRHGQVKVVVELGIVAGKDLCFLDVERQFERGGNGLALGHIDGDSAPEHRPNTKQQHHGRLEPGDIRH